MRLIFVRHGEPNYAKDCLTENGKEQAACTAKRLKDEDIRAIYASPMGRAVETASYTAKDHGLTVKTLDFMHEIDWGDARGEAVSEDEKLEFDGHPWTLGYKLLTENPQFVGSSEWKNHHYFKNNICLQYYEKVSAGIDELLEEYGLFRKNGLYEYRAGKVVSEAGNDGVADKFDDTVALFAHGGSGAILYSHLFNLPFPYVLTSMPYGVCSVSIISFSMEESGMIIPRLELFNDMGHIRAFKEEKLHFEK
ncbi:histidine phosphatase family protein [Butyrivibrio sp. AE3006]|uniref:histidine phosphatase family protein n=1 Tax=Butyrivibrio sp. AE3006 TaxID=1280673 RepID=UPI0003FC0E84|nr:histidine phosphatase family protein [Butyrivibrio sp. AE3006]